MAAVNAAITKSQRLEIQALAAKATPGPWWLSENDGCIHAYPVVTQHQRITK